MAQTTTTTTMKATTQNTHQTLLSSRLCLSEFLYTPLLDPPLRPRSDRHGQGCCLVCSFPPFLHPFTLPLQHMSDNHLHIVYSFMGISIGRASHRFYPHPFQCWLRERWKGGESWGWGFGLFDRLSFLPPGIVLSHRDRAPVHRQREMCN